MYLQVSDTLVIVGGRLEFILLRKCLYTRETMTPGAQWLLTGSSNWPTTHPTVTNVHASSENDTAAIMDLFYNVNYKDKNIFKKMLVV